MSLRRALPLLRGVQPAAFVACLVIAAALVAAAQASAGSPELPESVRLPDHVPEILAAATPVSAAEGANEILLTLVLRRDDVEGFEHYLRDLYDPASAVYRRFLTPGDLADRFGPSKQAYGAVRRYLEANGLELVDESTHRLTLTVRGDRAAAERAFDVQIRDYLLGHQVFYANDRDPAFPADLAPSVAAISGLSNAARPQHVGGKADGKAVLAGICAAVITGLALWLFPTVVGAIAALVLILLCSALVWFAGPTGVQENVDQFGGGSPAPGAARTATVSSSTSRLPGSGRFAGAIGTGQTVGLVQFDTFHRSDIEDFLTLFGASLDAMDHLSEVAVDGGVATPGAGESEVLLDVTAIMSIAPGADIVVYSAPFDGRASSYSAVFSAMIDDGVDIISNSWSSCENEVSQAEVHAIDLVLQSAAASGISVFNASGDTGSTCLNGSPNTVGVPASSPSATAVGGTTLLPGDGGTYDSERWWDGIADSPPTGQGGFGVSRHFPRPSYQDAETSAPGRSVPDVAAHSDPGLGRIICQASAGGCPNGALYGGTSVAAPEWAALTALLNERMGTNLGALNPQIYPLAGTGAFRDAASMGSDFAHVGLGSPSMHILHLLLSGEVAGGTDAVASRVVPIAPTEVLAAGGTEIPADGSAAGGVVVKLWDGAGHIVGGRTVTLAASSGNAQISPGSGVTTDDQGTVVFRVTNLTPETVDFTATDTSGGVVLAETASLTFAVPPATTAGIAGFPTSVPADGVSTTTITVTLEDALGRPTPGKEVALLQGPGHSIVQGPTPPETDANGEIEFTATNLVNETVTYTAIDVTDGDLPVPGSVDVTFHSGAGGACGSAAPPVGIGGYTVTPFANGFEAGPFSFGGVNVGGCAGAAVPAFLDGDVFVSNARTGDLFQLGSDGGAAVNALANHGPTLAAETVGLDGRLYAVRVATTGNFTTGVILELDPATGAEIRTVASNLTCPHSLVVDPLSGDLFYDDFCFGGGSDDPAIHRVRNPAGPNPTVEVYAILPRTPNGRMTFAPDGTLFVVTGYTDPQPAVVRVSGTDGPATPTIETIPDVFSFFWVNVAETGPSGEARSLLLLTLDGLELVDISGPTPVSTVIVEGMGGGVIGPDGCLYSSLGHTVFRTTDPTGGCSFVAASGAPSLKLTPAEVSPDPEQGSTELFTATFQNVNVPEGTAVIFHVSGANPYVQLVRTDAAGQASFSHTAYVAGDDVIRATVTLGAETLDSNPARVTWKPGPHVTFLALNLSPQGGASGQPVVVRASLTDSSTSPSVPVPGMTVDFTLGTAQCSGVTGADGIAECALTVGEPGSTTLAASFAGTSQFVASSDVLAFLAVDATALDHFMAYKTTPTKGAGKLVKLGPVTLGDTLGENDYDVLRPTHLAPPADKNDEGIEDSETHLAAYAIKPSKGSPKFEKIPDVRVVNQCGEVVVTLKKPTSLLVPTAKDLDVPIAPPNAAAHGVDHFLCYKATPQKKFSDGKEAPVLPKGTQVDVADQFQGRRYDLKKPEWLCNPTSKSGDPALLAGPQKGSPFPLEPAQIRNPSTHLLCYKAKRSKKRIEQNGCGPAIAGDKGTKIEPKQEKHEKRFGVYVANQLEATQVDTKTERLFCIPSAVLVP